MWLLKIWLKIKQSYVNFFDCLYLCFEGRYLLENFKVLYILEKMFEVYVIDATDCETVFQCEKCFKMLLNFMFEVQKVWKYLKISPTCTQKTPRYAVGGFLIL